MKARRPRSKKARGARGFILAESIVSTAIAGLAATLAIVVLITVSGQLEKAFAERGAARLTQAVYEEARLASAAQLNGVSTGQIGKYSWLRKGEGAVERDLPDSPVGVRIDVRWSVRGRPYKHSVRAVIAPASAR